ncbi:hypothetical protein SPBR_05506 [Sporothrix brasiliensis 5110]|uniref:Uncharacterized protein n=1 Tax=Sporothrix brasiliensis 5110 TaxID=1398154 RepID=A0A0C2IYS7_9PEZI|nr:uncharacterized protein SPBR_05506 [Sporothrix brasiliensis 5110]KIH94261.1 hypothetical protein SPBR_05506 [Sporothrix brasiliensis 5110]
MASSYPSTRGLDGEAVLERPTDSTPVATSLSRNSFADTARPTITAADFAPIQRPHPRPWKRIAVPGAGNKLGLRTVWKRVGGVPRSSADTRYFRGVFELRANGRGPRKHRRTERYVPVWGDARWQARETETPLEDDLAKARGKVYNRGPRALRWRRRGLTWWHIGADDVMAVMTVAEVIDTNILGRSLAFVPRKRNSHRQPLAVSLPTPIETRATESPVRAASVDDSLEAIEQSTEHITKRAKRRMSRRISILAKPEGSSLLSPEKKAAQQHVFSSPVKRRASVVNIHEPPATPATPAIDAAPATPGTARCAKSVATIAPPIAFEPTFSSPIKTLAPMSENLSPAKAACPSGKLMPSMSPVVVFDRPAAEETEAESPHEVQRRISFHNARRRETLFSTMERRSPAKATSAARTSRRHSFMPQHVPLVFAQASAKKTLNRRHTFQPGGLGIFLASAGMSFDENISKVDDVQSVSVSEPDNSTSTIEISGLDESTVNDPPSAPKQDETVVVDLRTNLDIFGSGPPVQTHHSPSSEHHVSFDLKPHVGKPTSSTPTKATIDGKAIAQISSPAPKANGLLDVPAAELESINDPTDNPSDESLDTVNDEDTADVSNESTPRSLSPEMDIDISEEDSREVTDEMGIVSRRRATQLDESLLLPLPETTETETETVIDMDAETKITKAETKGDDYGWQSPTSAELGHLRDAMHTPQQDKTAEIAISPAAPLMDVDMELLVDENDVADHEEMVKEDELVDEEEEVEDVEDVGDLGDLEDQAIEDMEEVDNADAAATGIDDVFTAPASTTEDLSDGSSPARSVDEENGEYTLTQPFNMFPGGDDDATTTMTMDFDNLAQDDQLSAHEDSETEMLRKFVTRVKADKSAKAAAAAEEASARTLAKLQRRRRSGSISSTASLSGSPMNKKEPGVFGSPFTSLEGRIPFGKKDHNMSPSPRKKRRPLVGPSDGNENRSEDLLSKPLFDDNSPPRPKRRRKKMEVDTGGIFNPEFMSTKKDDTSAEGGDDTAPGPRRSKRTRNQTSLKSAAPTANGAAIVLSHIPVRLPGSLNLNGDDSFGLSTSSLSLRRNDEKDLAATTRVNTRKNKGNADPPCIVVARQSHEALRAMREQKSVFDSPLLPPKTASREKADKTDKADKADRPDNDEGHGKSRKAKKTSKSAKSVRWAEVLARFQTDDETAEKGATKADSAAAGPDVGPTSNPGPAESVRSSRATEQPLSAETAEVPESAPSTATLVSTAPFPTSAPNASSAPSADPAPQGDADKSSIPRRTTRVSRLQPPTQRKMFPSIAAKAAAAPPPAAAPAEPAPMGLKALPSGGRMATRRAKIVGMGMAGNGTPAPKRRTTRTT